MQLGVLSGSICQSSLYVLHSHSPIKCRFAITRIMFKTLFASSFGLEYTYSPLYFIQVLNHSLHTYTLGNSKTEPEEIYMHNFKQWISNNGQSKTKIFFSPEVLEESLSSHSQERHLVDSREPGYQVMTMLYSLPAENNLDKIQSC